MPPLLTECQAAEMLNISPRSIRKARAMGDLPYVLIGRSVRIHPADIEAFIARATIANDLPSLPQRPGITRRHSSKIMTFTQRNGR